MLSRLETLMELGDLDGARNRLRRSPGFERVLANTRANDPVALRGGALIAEIRLAFGDIAGASQALARAKSRSLAEVLSLVPARYALQLAELEYATSPTPKPAIEIAQTILSHAERHGERRDIGECLFYLARFELRQSDPYKANGHCMRGLEMLLRAEPSGLGAPGLQWQTGRMLRVRGTALWWQGRVAEATAVLYLSAWILRQTAGARLHLGDALHALGRLLRSQGLERYGDAKAALEEASASYRDHELKLARTLIDLARVELNMALLSEPAPTGSPGSPSSKDARQLFDKAKECIARALEVSEPHTAGQSIMPVWRRQHIDGLVWQSWFRQEAIGHLDVDGALKSAKQAIELAAAVPGSPEAIEASLVCGTCELIGGDLQRAAELMTPAIDWARRSKIPKLQVQASLCLAQLEARRGNIRDAFGHLDAARDIVREHEFLSQYLVARIADVERVLKATLPSDRLLLSLDDLLAEPLPPGWRRIKVIRTLTEAWLLDAAIRRKGKAKDGRDLLGIKEDAATDIRNRAKVLRAASSK